MNFCCKLLLVFLIIILIFPRSVSAQYSNNFVAGLGAGTFVYQGDLVPGTVGGYKRLTPAIQLHAGKWVNPYFQFRLNFATGKIAANDADYSEPAWKKERNLRFQTSIHELTARLLFSPLGNPDVTPDKHVYPYVFAGAGASFIKVKRDWSGMSDSSLSNSKTTQNLAADSAHKLPNTILTIPFGAGISYSISPRLAIFGDAAYNLPVTDYLDGFSYIANNSKKDNYYHVSVGINYTFLRNAYTKCPRVLK